jgi:hypothetical protein
MTTESALSFAVQTSVLSVSKFVTFLTKFLLISSTVREEFFSDDGEWA